MTQSINMRAYNVSSHINIELFILKLIRIGKLTKGAGKYLLARSLLCIDKTGEDFEDLISDLTKLTKEE